MSPGSSTKLALKRMEGKPRKNLNQVTGAASSIGRQLALQLSGLGCNVICVDSDAEGNMRTVQVIVKQGYKAQAHTCDVTDNTAVEVLAKNVGYVDILINSAGVIYFDPILKTQQAMVSKVLDINVASHFVMIRNFLPQMLERNKGHIVGIASCSGLLGVSNAALYSCSKFAVVVQATIELRIPPLDVEDGIRQIVQGILQERSMFTVPNHMLALINIGRQKAYAYVNMWASVVDDCFIGPYLLPSPLNGNQYYNFQSALPDLLDNVPLAIRRRM
ncbi:hypothetical protein ANN_08109 [Periplaneta americana]|uniref:Uncharacterized protein n=1 Tax=Periplaneta americana TaxID=6978 RepID=A0ABQ8T0F9_PERAM|nr:hypothetical protein ANN_08109 [Periplaneta americana]